MTSSKIETLRSSTGILWPCIRVLRALERLARMIGLIALWWLSKI
jgi:hypothetical protein